MIKKKKNTRNESLNIIQDWKHKYVTQKHGIC